MPQQRQEKSCWHWTRRKGRWPFLEKTPLSLIAWHSRVAAHRLGNCLKASALPKRGCCLWVTPTAAAGQPWHFQPCWPGGWVRPSPAPIVPLCLMDLWDQPSAAVAHSRVIKKNTTLQFLLGCLCLTHSAEHCCPHLEHLFPLWSLLLWGIPLTTSSSASKLKSLEGFVKWEMMGGRREKLHRNQAETVPNKTRMPTEWQL